ncbi:formate dehydrogenase subunit delta [Pseudohoeflea sp. DP4N28-3]|uniref:Formate dehydrogenase subunit delta n=2 Tax=Pseudohoeflea coraliihabitans TaxID=2860393 RepID=A0ABS6WQY9_9HYPH|nr:formate dehydrogenase subunit delta [Pseudohoeflea sp. DP4N28-3]MBW3098374.1 formate dehydrogenase subunit delta [Pseudohoeflea sp. DP4N28-3]
MRPDKLVYMANQIAGFFKSQPVETAAAGVAEHINKFWEPRMRAQLAELTDAHAAQLQPLVREAMPLIRRPTETHGADVPSSGSPSSPSL